LALRYLQVALTRHDSVETHWKYRQVVSDQLFAMNDDIKSNWRMPGWLVEWELSRDPVGWISRALRYGWVAEAVQWSLDWIRRVSLCSLALCDDGFGKS
jgi:nuclear pore complex protein Nup160